MRAPSLDCTVRILATDRDLPESFDDHLTLPDRRIAARPPARPVAPSTPASMAVPVSFGGFRGNAATTGSHRCACAGGDAFHFCLAAGFGAGSTDSAIASV